jgi:hypothetical protein
LAIFSIWVGWGSNALILLLLLHVKGKKISPNGTAIPIPIPIPIHKGLVFHRGCREMAKGKGEDEAAPKYSWATNSRIPLSPFELENLGMFGYILVISLFI